MRSTMVVFALLVGCTDTGTTSIGNDLVGPDDPGLTGIFNLGPDDYYAHSARLDAAPVISHVFVDWVSQEALAAASKDPSVQAEPQPIGPEDFKIFDYVYEPGTIIALSLVLPLPNYDVLGPVYPQIPRVQSIIDGDYDGIIDDYAVAIGALDSQVMLTMFGEFDNNAYYSFGPEGLHGAAEDPDLPASYQVPVADDLTGYYGDPKVPDGPERVRDAFIHVIDRFRAAGVTNVSWFMYGSSGFLSVVADSDEVQLVEADKWWNTPEHYYPGDDYIDWVGKSLHHEEFEDLGPKFEHAYAKWGEVTKRPFFSPEFSIDISSSTNASREEAIRKEFGQYFLDFPRFKAFAMCDQDPKTSSDEFGINTLGGVNGEYPGEITAWKETVVDSGNWKTLPSTL